jgi:hypothetical protein
MGAGRDWLWGANKWIGTDSRTTEEARRIEAERLESEKLSLSGHRSDDIGDHSCEENFQTNLGLYEEEVWREC